MKILSCLIARKNTHLQGMHLPFGAYFYKNKLECDALPSWVYRTQVLGTLGSKESRISSDIQI